MYRRADEIPQNRVDECVRAFSGALREQVRAIFPLPDSRSSSSRWWATNRGRIQLPRRLPVEGGDQHRSHTTHVESADLIAHEAYPPHTEHCREEQLLVGGGQRRQTIFLVNTPQCLMAEGWPTTR